MSMVATRMYYRGEQGQVYVEPTKHCLVYVNHVKTVCEQLKEIWQCEVTVVDQFNVILYRTNQDLAV